MTDQGVPARSTMVRVIVLVLDENDNRPIFMEKVYKIKLPEREKVEKERSVRREPVYRVIASDRDHGANAEISYSIEDGDEQGKFFIEPKTGLVSSKKFSTAGEYDILTVRPADKAAIWYLFKQYDDLMMIIILTHHITILFPRYH